MRLCKRRYQCVHQSCHHEKTNDDQKYTANTVNDVIVALNPCQCAFKLFDKNGTQKKGNAKPKGVAQQEQDTIED